jgi:LmbE family N-acetylglucosaminyl deacetylase
MRAPSVNPLVLHPRSFPLVRPQITCVDDTVYFGSCPVAQVTQAELDFLKACTGAHNLADAASAAGIEPTCVARVASWLLWWDRKVIAMPQPFSPPVDRLVLSATHAGAWLGMGGRMLIEPQQYRTAVITCFGSLGETRFVEPFPTLAEVSMAGRDEAAFVAKLSGIQQRVLDFPDQALRETLAARGSGASEIISDALREAMLEIIDEYQPSEIFAPAALGPSADARLIFEILLSLFAEGDIQAELHLFEDEPAIHGHRSVDEFLSRFEGAYVAPREYYVDVTGSFPEKLSLTDVFRCSMDRREAHAWSQSAERNAMLGGGPATQAERFWNLNITSIET